LSFSNNETSSGVGDLDVEFLGAFDNDNAVFSRDVVSNFSSKDTVLHHEHFEFRNVTNDNFAETRGEHVFGSLGRSITDAGHGSLTRETTTNTVINTLGLAPRLLDRLEAIRLMTLERLVAFLDNGGLRSRRDHLQSKRESEGG
jgi:hypothetical protein